MKRLASWVAKKVIGKYEIKQPDFVIGGGASPYLLRWFLIPRNPIFNVYLHLFLRSDDDRALHCHPWANASLLLRGSYVEHTIAAGGVHQHRVMTTGDFKVRPSGRHAHRIELTDGPCWTLFITGPRYRQWGFHCAERGWVHWATFTAPGEPGQTGKGCSE